MKWRFLLPALLFFSAAFCQEPSFDKALTVARNFYIDRRYRTNGVLLKKVSFEAQSKGNGVLKLNYYVFNLTGNSGFVVVSGDEKAYPVLAYSFSGSFNEINVPTVVWEWMKSYSQQIADLKNHKSLPSGKIKNAWETYSNSHFVSELIFKGSESIMDIPPLLSTKWNQGRYYNTLCPECPSGGSGGHVWAGCVATAQAQVMKFYEYPDIGTGSHSYHHSVYGELSADFENTNYNWSGMPNSLSTYNDDVARLIYHCGVSVNMNYSPSGSGASGSSVRSSLVNYFKYSTNSVYTSKYNYTEENWKKLLRSEIDESRPLFYIGHGSGGHAFVCDGYQGADFFHFNWGWGGSYNGYFYVDDLTPGSYDFTNSQSVIAGGVPITQETGIDSLHVVDLTSTIPYTGTTTGGKNNANLYAGIGWQETGKEIIHRISSSFKGRITARIHAADSNNLDVFISRNASRLSVLAWGDSLAILDDADTGTYYIIVDGRYGGEGNYTLEVTCPDNRPDLVFDEISIEPQMVESNQNALLQAVIRNAGNSMAGSSVIKYFFSSDPLLSVNDKFLGQDSIAFLEPSADTLISTFLSMPDSLGKGTEYLILHLDANDEVDETDENLNTQFISVQIPDSGKLNCSNTVALSSGITYYGNSLTEGDSVVDNYNCYWGLTNKEVVHSFTPEYSGLAEIKFSESLPGIMNVLVLTSCNENTCINSFGIWNPEDTVTTSQFHVTGGLTYILVIDGNNDFGISEGTYSINVKFPEKCPTPKIETFSSINKCVGDPGAYLYTNWEYRNFQWLKDSKDIPGATNASFRADETGVYTVKTTENGCTGVSEGVQVKYSSKPSASHIIALSDTVFCEGETTLLQLITGSGYTYQWTRNDEFLTNETRLILEAGLSGIYKARVTHESCTIESNPVTINALHSAKNIGEILNITTDSLLSYWPFTNWGIDESGHGNYAGIYGARQVKDRKNKYTAFYFDGIDDYINTSLSYAHPDTFTLSLWFKTMKSGKLIGFHSEPYNVASTNFDRHLYIGDDGKIYFGIENETKYIIKSSGIINDDTWHLATATLSANGMKLYVDGVLTDEKSIPVSGANYIGYWKMAYGSLEGWPAKPESLYFEGSLDDVRIYNRALNMDEIETIYAEQVIRVKTAENNFCGGPDSTNIIVENSESGILYQLVQKEDSLPVGPIIEGNSGTIFLSTGSLIESTSFLISATNGLTMCSTFLDTTLFINFQEKKIPEVHIYNDAIAGGICMGDTIHFYSSTMNGGTNPVYQWQLNGVPVSETSPEFTSHVLNDQDTVSLLLTSSFVCVSQETVASNPLVVQVNLLPDNTVNINKSSFCQGDSARLLSPEIASFQWFKNGQVLPDTGQSLTVKTGGNYQLALTNSFGCRNTSGNIPVEVYPLPGISLGSDTSIYTGDSMILDAGSGFSSYAWNTGSIEQTVLIDSSSGPGIYKYTVQVTGNRGCVNSDGIFITIMTATGLDTTSGISQFSLYPNPATTFIILEFKNNTGSEISVEIRDITGKITRKKIYASSFLQVKDELDVKALSKGIYFVRLISKQGQTTKKFVIH